jgi:thymidylate synthase (FAD)
MKKNIFNDGFVELIDSMGDDLKVVNTARVSYGKESQEFTDKDMKLLHYLWDHEHTSPFRHCFLSFRIRAPIFVLRQWMKHQIGCSWNEQSARYTELKHGCFAPDTWRYQDTKNKQSSQGAIEDQEQAFELMNDVYELAYKNYEKLLDLGVCREQARIVLPVAVYSECIWTTSLQGLMHFIELRADKASQYEIQLYAQAVKELAYGHFKNSIDLLNKK